MSIETVLAILLIVILTFAFGFVPAAATVLRAARLIIINGAQGVRQQNEDWRIPPPPRAHPCC
jgi:hypothetical protein